MGGTSFLSLIRSFTSASELGFFLSSRFHFMREEKKRNCCCLSPHKHREINQGCNFDLLHGALFARWHLHVDAVKESRWQSAAANSESHKSIWCRTPINPCSFPAPTAPLRFFFTSVAISVDTEVQSYTACYPCFTIKQCQDLDWISSSRWPSARSHGCVSAAPPRALSPKSSRPI